MSLRVCQKCLRRVSILCWGCLGNISLGFVLGVSLSFLVSKLRVTGLSFGCLWDVLVDVSGLFE